MLKRLPRLSVKSSTELRKAFCRGMTEFSHSDLIEVLNRPEAYPLTAGKHVRFGELEDFRRRCRIAAADAGENMTSFDVLLGAELYHFGQQFRGDLGNPLVWDFLTLILLPDLAAVRYNPRNAPSSRFTGGDRRHVFQRLWRRWLVLGPAIVQSQRLTEDDYVALLERRVTSERPVLAKMTAEKIVNSGFTGHQRRQYTRIFIKRLQQMSGVVFLDENDTESLQAVFNEIDEHVREQVQFSRAEDDAEQ